jgi:siroheme synthase-like protein
VAFDYPIMVDLAGVPVLVVGGGRVAHRKIEGLLKAGADVTVVAKSAIDSIRSMPVHVVLKPYETADLDRVRLVISATDDPAVNAAVSADATASGIWVNSADDPANCTFILPAVARDGDVTVAVSTGGASPALASHLRGEIEGWLDQIGAADAAVTLAAQRSQLRASGVSTESVDWTDRVQTALRQPT